MAEARELAVVAAAGSPSGRMKYRGVAYTPSGKCSASITEPGSKKKLWLGMYPNAEVAACAYDMAAKSLQGDKAKTNFTYPPPHHLIDAVAAAPGRRGPVFTVPPSPAPAPATAPPPPVAPAAVPFYHEGHFSYKAPPRDPDHFPAFPFLQDPSRLLQRAPGPAPEPKPDARITLVRSIPPKPFDMKATVAASRHASNPMDQYGPRIHIVAPAREPSPASSVETGVSCTKAPQPSGSASPPRIMASNSIPLMLKTPKVFTLKEPKIIAVRATAPTPAEGFSGDNFTGMNVPFYYNVPPSTLMPLDVGALQTPETAEGMGNTQPGIGRMT